MKKWFTKTRIIVYGTLLFLIALFTVYAGGKAIASDITAKAQRTDSTLFVKWHTPCDKVRVEKEFKTDIQLMKIDCKLDQLLTARMSRNADSQFKKDSLRYLTR